MCSRPSPRSLQQLQHFRVFEYIDSLSIYSDISYHPQKAPSIFGKRVYDNLVLQQRLLLERV